MYRALELMVGKKRIRGCARIPEGQGRYPAVCFFHGFTVEKVGLMRLHELFARMCEKEGIVCIRFDFFGCGESDGEFSEMRFLDEVEQAEAIYRWTKDQDFTEEGKIFLAGHSLGGAVASIAAAHVQPLAAILWAAGNTAYYDISKRVGAIPGQYEESYDVGGLELSGAFLEELRRVDITKESKGFKGDVLLVHGEMDEKIPIASVGPYLDVYGKKAKLEVIPGADHQFTSIAWKNQVYEASLDFMKKCIVQK